MAFTDNIKEITPAITLLKSNTPVIVIDGKIYVAGIGGNFIPSDKDPIIVEPIAGYAVNNNGVITFRPVNSSDSESVSNLKIVDTGVEEPLYSIEIQAGGLQNTSNTSNISNTILLGKGLMLYFNMDDSNSTVMDSVSNIELNKSGNIENGAVGVEKTCWQVSSNTGYLLGTQNAITLPNSFTLNMWVYVTYVAYGNCTVVEFGSYTNSSGFGFYINDSHKISPRVSKDWDNYTGEAISLNSWHMLTMTKDGGTVKSYIDGVLDTSRSGVSDIVNSNKIGMFSREAVGLNGLLYFQGKLDLIGLWDYAMTPLQINNLMAIYI